MPNPRLHPETIQPQVDYTTVKTCPQCGSTELQAEIIIPATQNAEGHWSIAEFDQDSIDYAMTNPNFHVRCANPYCGQLQDADGKQLPFISAEEALAHFCQMKEIILPEMTETALAEAHPDLFQEYNEWVDGFQHIPWKGVIGECHTL